MCQDVEELGKREITTMKTLLQWSGKTEEEIYSLVNESKDGFIIDGYIFKEYLTPKEIKAKRERDRYIKAIEKKQERIKKTITDTVKWDKDEKPTKVSYEVNGEYMNRKDTVKTLRTNSTTLMRLVREYKQFTMNGNVVKMSDMKKNSKKVHLYKDGMLVMSGTVEEIAVHMCCSKENIYSMYIHKRKVRGYEVFTELR